MNQLGLFAKYWEPGRVKTRLAAGVGFHRACRVYFAFVRHLLDVFQEVADSRSVVFAPAKVESKFRRVVPAAWDLIPQSDGGLGLRMETFFQQQFNNQGAEKIVIIGADCPQLSAVEIEEAFATLDQNDVVVGPSSDGGYYLLGMKSQCYDIFSDIAWSTETVLQHTKDHLSRLGVRFDLLDTKTDIDESADLERWLQSSRREYQSNGGAGVRPVSKMDKLVTAVESILAGPDEPDVSWGQP